MQLTPADRQKIKDHVLANVNTVVTPQNPEGVAINLVPVTVDYYTEVTDWYNALVNPAYWVWKSAITRSEVYHKVGPDGTVWVWNTFKAQSITEQNTWTQMFMNDIAAPYLLTFREGVFNVFSGSAQQNTQRAHVLASFRRQARRWEQVLATAVVTVGGIAVDVDNGNVLVNALGDSTNPAVLPIGTDGTYSEGVITAAQLVDAVIRGSNP